MAKLEVPKVLPFPGAEEAAEHILTHRDDVSLIVPHSLGRCFVGRAGTPEYWYRATMRMLEASQAVVLIDGWKSSRGARAEFRRAVELGIAVYATPFDLTEPWGARCLRGRLRAC